MHREFRTVAISLCKLLVGNERRYVLERRARLKPSHYSSSIKGSFSADASPIDSRRQALTARVRIARTSYPSSGLSSESWRSSSPRHQASLSAVRLPLKAKSLGKLAFTLGSVFDNSMSNSTRAASGSRRSLAASGRRRLSAMCTRARAHVKSPSTAAARSDEQGTHTSRKGELRPLARIQVQWQR